MAVNTNVPYPSPAEIRAFFEECANFWLDIAYLKHLNNIGVVKYLRQRQPLTFQCQCPLCGGNAILHPKGIALVYRCYRCEESLSFSTLLKRVSPQLHADYVIDLKGGPLRLDSPIYQKWESR